MSDSVRARASRSGGTGRSAPTPSHLASDLATARSGAVVSRDPHSELLGTERIRRRPALGGGGVVVAGLGWYLRLDDWVGRRPRCWSPMALTGGALAAFAPRPWSSRPWPCSSAATRGASGAGRPRRRRRVAGHGRSRVRRRAGSLRHRPRRAGRGPRRGADRHHPPPGGRADRAGGPVEVETARAEVERARAELLAERNHLAREIHDVLAHTLAALSLQLEAFDTVVDAEPGDEPRRPRAARDDPSAGPRGARRGPGAVRHSATTPRRSPSSWRGCATQHEAAFTSRAARAPLPAGVARPLPGRPGGADQRHETRAGRTDAVDLFLSRRPRCRSPSTTSAPVHAAARTLARAAAATACRASPNVCAARSAATSRPGPCRTVAGGVDRRGPARATSTACADDTGAAARMKVLIADDQRVVREGLATIVAAFPDTEVVGLAGRRRRGGGRWSPSSARRRAHGPAYAADGRRGGHRAIRERHPAIAVVVLTTFADDESIVAALSAGAAGYLTKDAARDDIRRALEAAVRRAVRARPRRPGDPAQGGRSHGAPAAAGGRCPTG